MDIRGIADTFILEDIDENKIVDVEKPIAESGKPILVVVIVTVIHSSNVDDSNNHGVTVLEIINVILVGDVSNDPVMVDFQRSVFSIEDDEKSSDVSNDVKSYTIAVGIDYKRMDSVNDVNIRQMVGVVRAIKIAITIPDVNKIDTNANMVTIGNMVIILDITTINNGDKNLTVIVVLVVEKS